MIVYFFDIIILRNNAKQYKGFYFKSNRIIMNTSQIIIQSIGIAGLLSFAISYQIKSIRMLFLMQLIGSALFCVQFILLGAISGCVGLVINIIRNAMLMQYKQWHWVRRKIWPIIISIIFTILLIPTWTGYASLLPYIAAITSTFAYWTDNAFILRMTNLLCASPCWLIYDIIYFSLGGIASESMSMVSILVSFVRFGRMKK